MDEAVDSHLAHDQEELFSFFLEAHGKLIAVIGAETSTLVPAGMIMPVFTSCVLDSSARSNFRVSSGSVTFRMSCLLLWNNDKLSNA